MTDLLDDNESDASLRRMLSPEGACVFVFANTHEGVSGGGELPLPQPPRAQIDELIATYLAPHGLDLSVAPKPIDMGQGPDASRVVTGVILTMSASGMNEILSNHSSFCDSCKCWLFLPIAPAVMVCFSEFSLRWRTLSVISTTRF